MSEAARDRRQLRGVAQLIARGVRLGKRRVSDNEQDRGGEMNVLSLPKSANTSAHVLLTSAGRGWSGLQAEFRHIQAGPTKVAASLWHRLGVHHGPSVNATCRCDDRVSRRVQSHGDADFVPAGFEGEWRDDSDCSILSLSVSPALARQVAEDIGVNPDRALPAPRFQLRDPGLSHIAWALKAALETETIGDRLYVDSLGAALAKRLIMLQSDRGGAASSAKPSLSAPQKRRLREFIEANLAHSLTLADLAAVAGVGGSQLKALFPQAFGQSAHQYVVRRRVARAKILLLSGALPISQVALESGFAHQSHMAHWMKRVLGVTPREIVSMR
jgi:AraC family transcriptional regulator